MPFVAAYFLTSLFFVFATFISGAIVSADNGLCDKGIAPVSGQAGYKLRGDRCEGIYKMPVGANSIEFVSLLKGKIMFDPKYDPSMEISAGINGVKPKVPVKVRVVALPLKSYYRMDTVLTPGRPLIWPIEEVLHPVGLQVNMIGILGWIGNDDDRTFIPLRVTQKGNKSAEQSSDPVNLVVRCTVDVVDVKWSYYVEGEQDTVPSTWRKVNVRSPVSAGVPITITLPDGIPSKAILEVKAREVNTDNWYSNDIRVSIKGSQ